jgi:hypothetical protein
MMYAKAFFDLQLAFADKVAARAGLSQARALLDFTNLYIRFGLGRGFDPVHPVWQEYLAGLQPTEDRGDWTYRFYRQRSEVTEPPGVVAAFGCFAYARRGPDRIRLHFRNAERASHSALSAERRERRLTELAALFDHARQTLVGPAQVVGASWLYNLHAYRRLFPDSYLATAHVLSGRFRHMPLWGQFLDRHGQVKETVARQFLARLDGQVAVDDLDLCFPFPVLAVEAPVQDFCEFYESQGHVGGLSPGGTP